MKDDKYTDILDELDDKELLQCLQAAKLADTEPAEKLSESRAREFVSQKTAPKVIRMRFPWVAGISIAAALAVAAFIFLRSPAIPDVVADNQPDTEEADILDRADESLGEEESVPLEVEQTKSQKAIQTAKTEKTQSSAETIEQIVPTEISQEDVSHAASSEMYMFEMIKPAKDLYRIHVKDTSKSFSFEWDPVGIEGARLILQDCEGNVFHQQDFTDEGYYDLPVSVALPYGDVVWSFFVQYQDGREARKSGVISFIKAE